MEANVHARRRAPGKVGKARRSCARPLRRAVRQHLLMDSLAYADQVQGQRKDGHKPLGSIPAALMAAAASGEVRNLNSAMAASGWGAVLRIPA